MKKLIHATFALVACLAIGVASYAAVIVDENGVGFIGKGDIQLAFGWNNKQLQDNAGGLTFYFTSSETAEWECEWFTGNRNVTHHTQTRDTVAEVSTSVAYDVRKNHKGQITGFNLNGFAGDPIVTTEGPAAGTCDGNKTLVVGSLSFDDSADEGTIWAQHNGTKVALLDVDQAE